MSELELIYPSGIDEKTLKSHYRQPHKRSTSHTQQLIETLHEKYFSTPFPNDIEALMRLYNNLIDCSKHASKESDIDDLQLFLNTQVQQPSSSLLRLARLHWLLANTYFDRLPELRTGSKRGQLLDNQQEAIKHFKHAIILIDKHNQQAPDNRVTEYVLYKVRQNILACYLNAVDPEQRENDEKVLDYLTHSDFLVQSEKVLQQEPYLWVVARNGLRFSSLLKSKAHCEYFFKQLITASQYFLELTYKPQGYPAISESKEFSWACEHVFTPEFIDTLR